MNQLDDAEARKLLSPLAVVPDDGPLWLDLPEIERAGRRRRRRSRLAAGALTVIAVAAGCGTVLALRPATTPDTPPAGPQASHGALPPGLTPVAAPVGAKCVATPFAGPTGRVYAVDRSGHYAVEIVGSSAVIWKDGQRATTVALPSSDRVEVAVNTGGQLALTVGSVPYAYADGTLIRLKGGGTVADIAGDGRIGGISGNLPVIWANPQAEPTRLAVPTGTTYGKVLGFDTDGTILGTVQNSSSTRRTVLWRNGSSKAQIVKVPTEYAGVGFTGIRDGKIVGSDALTVAVSYDIASKKFTKLPAQAAGLEGIGGQGTVLGAPTGNDPIWAIVGGTAHELAPLNGIASYSIVRVADDGHTVFGNSWPDDKAVPTKWNCG